MRTTAWMAAACAMALMTSACTSFVKPEANSPSVRIATADEAKGCTKLGRTEVTVPYKFGFIHRSAKAIDDDLAIMGRNSAVDMHGDTIVATSPPHHGKQSFDIFRCRQ